MSDALAAAGVPPRMLPFTWEHWRGDRPEVPETFEILTVSGPVGTGKTHVAVSLLAERLESGLRPGSYQHRVRDSGEFGNYRGTETRTGGLFADVQEAVESLKPSARDPNARLAALLRAELLVFDDFGVERPTEFTLDRVSFILRHRYNHLLPTIITTNLSPSQLNAIDPRLASRILSGARIKRNGKDQRFA